MKKGGDTLYLEERIIDKYFYIWAIFLPITSVLLIPSIQGTTIGYVLAFMSLGLVPFISKYRNNVARFFGTFSLVFIVFLLLQLLAQFFLANSRTVDFSSVILVDPYNYEYLFKNTLVTQSLYIVAAFLTFSFVRTFYSENWDKFLFIGAVLLASYGFYEFFSYFFTGTNNDFLTNRTFTDDWTGSSFQLMYIGPYTFMRLKSLTGEPSMYALTIIPFWLYAIGTNRKKTAILLLISLCLSTSSTAVLAMVIFLFTKLKNIKNNILFWYFTVFGALIASITIGFSRIYEFLDVALLQKIQLQNQSGISRITNLNNHINFFTELPFFNKLFGVGFGYVRSTDLFSTLLVNNGLVGIILFSMLFIYPIFKLGKSQRSGNIKLIIFTLYLILMVSVSEFAYLTTWVFLGIAYNQLLKEKIQKRQLNIVTT